MATSTWDEQRLIESKADHIRAEAELKRASPEFLKASLEVTEQRLEQAEKARSSQTLQRIGMALVGITGKAAVIHLIWASAIVALTWIVVCYGWRG